MFKCIRIFPQYEGEIAFWFSTYSLYITAVDQGGNYLDYITMCEAAIHIDTDKILKNRDRSNYERFCARYD